MRRTAVSLALLAACATALPSAARAFEWAGRVGLLYGQRDTWMDNGPTTSGPQLDLDLGLDLSGALYRPGVFDYVGGVNYRKVTNSYASRDEKRDLLSYRFLGRAFANPGSPLTLDLRANRTDGDTSSAGTSATTVGQGYGVTATWADRVHPGLSVGYQHDDSTDHVPLIGAIDRKVEQFRASTAFGAPAYSYRADYRATLNDGTYDTDQYAEHRVDLTAAANVASTVTASFQNAFQLRLPSNDAALNLRQQLESFSVDVRGGLDPTTHTATYQYAHATSLSSAVDLERNLQRIAYGTQRLLAPEWRIRLRAIGSLNEDRNGAGVERTSGETLEAVLYWRRTTGAAYTEFSAGPRVGAIQIQGDGAKWGHGVQAGTQIGRPLGSFNGTLSYGFSYASDVEETGWSMDQQLVATTDGRLGLGTIRGQVIASATRRTADLLGTTAARSLSGTVGYQWTRNDVYVQVGAQDGTAGAVSGVNGDGLFIPAPYDSHSRFVVGAFGTRPFAHLGGRFNYRYTSTDTPDRPSYSQQDAWATVEFDYGALRLSIEDRYTVTDAPQGSVRDNQVLFRLTRLFGSRH